MRESNWRRAERSWRRSAATSSTPARSWKRFSSTRRGCAERPPPNCSCSTGTYSASRGWPARRRRNIANTCWSNRSRGTGSSTVGRAAEDKRTQQIPDVLADPDYGRQDLQRLAGFRTLLSTPMILRRRGRRRAVHVAHRGRSRSTSARRRSARGVRRCRRRWRPAAGRADAASSRPAAPSSPTRSAQLEALREVGEAVGSSLDVDEVLERIVSNAVRLTQPRLRRHHPETDGGSIMEYDERATRFLVRSVYRQQPDAGGPAAGDPDRPRRDPGRPGRQARPTARGPRPRARSSSTPICEILFQDGWRSVLAVPMLREDQIVGVLVIRRKRHGRLPAETIELLETFASQSALAIVNARLFRELREQERRARDRQPAQVGVPGEHVARAADAAQRRARLLRGAAGADVRRDQRAPGGVPARHLRLRPAPARAAQRDPRPVQGRGRPDGAGVLARSTSRGALDYTLAMLRERAALHAHRPHGGGRRRRRAGLRRRAAAQAGPAQPDDQRRQVHPRRRLRVVRADRDGAEILRHGDRHRHRRAARRTGSGSSSRSSRAAGARRKRRAPASA